MNKNERKQKRQAAALARKQRKKEGSLLSRLASFSIIVYIFNCMTDAIYNCFVKGMFGRMFTAYSYEERAFEKGAVYGYFSEHGSGFFRRARAKLSGGFEGSYFLDKFGRLIKKLLEVPVKLYGNLLLSFGVYSVLVYFVIQLFSEFKNWDNLAFGISVSAIVISLPLHLSKESLGRVLANGRITRMLVIETLGFKDEDLNIAPNRTRRKANSAIIVGMLAGLFTAFVNVFYLILSLLLVVLVLLIVAVPEVGVMLSIFFIPFYSLFEAPSLVLLSLVLVSAFGYIIKLARGKRLFKLEVLDLFVIIFLVIIFMSGIISAGGVGSWTSALLCCSLLLGYFLFVNMMRTQFWIDRCVNALIASGVITAGIGVFEFVFGKAQPSWIDTSYFGDIEGRVVSFFDNPNVLSAYLIIVFPFLLSKLFGAKTLKGRLLAFLCTATVVTCMILTYSRSAWIAAIAVFLIFALINYRRTLKWLFGFVFVIPFLPFFLPSSVINRFLSIGDISESSNFYRVYTWRGTLNAIREHFWGGVGYGTEAYAEIYPQYAYAGIEAAEHSHNLYLQILFGMGVFGLLMFCIVMFLFAQKNFEFYKNNKRSQTRFAASAGFSAILGVLIIGLFDYPWYNYRVFFLFWIAMAISCACIRIGDRDADRQKMVNVSSYDKAAIDI